MSRTPSVRSDLQYLGMIDGTITTTAQRWTAQLIKDEQQSLCLGLEARSASGHNASRPSSQYYGNTTADQNFLASAAGDHLAGRPLLRDLQSGVGQISGS
ncbi:hypothetical protein FEF26_01625 [Nesterenkonia salmonea]|uniref:Uncharacterized protein n=1 Tax=Nesterenkonia salmonea TaxID=1804987 RepID=A0A5R9BK59_9MICC|nr:hypothetical protein [Nesterenkonia salmonea]TLQ00291.1 hypothetical protein FEF26_01625 [Nesterenkonia salmonea]